MLKYKVWSDAYKKLFILNGVYNVVVNSLCDFLVISNVIYLIVIMLSFHVI